MRQRGAESFRAVMRKREASLGGAADLWWTASSLAAGLWAVTAEDCAGRGDFDGGEDQLRVRTGAANVASRSRSMKRFVPLR